MESRSPITRWLRRLLVIVLLCRGAPLGAQVVVNISGDTAVATIALPKPGDWRQLCIQVARLHARPLDMSKPLWEFTVIEGLDNIPNVPKGSYAIVSKVHHCAIDGASGVDIVEALHTLEPETEGEEPDAPWRPGRRPGDLELLARANFNNVLKPFHALDVGRRMAPGALKFAAGVTRGEIRLMGAKIPRTRRWRVTERGRHLLGLAVQLYRATWPELAAA